MEKLGRPGLMRAWAEIVAAGKDEPLAVERAQPEGIIQNLKEIGVGKAKVRMENEMGETGTRRKIKEIGGGKGGKIKETGD